MDGYVPFYWDAARPSLTTEGGGDALECALRLADEAVLAAAMADANASTRGTPNEQPRTTTSASALPQPPGAPLGGPIP